MSLGSAEFETIINDQSKVIAGDISWSEDEDHSPSVEFRVEVSSASGWPLFVCGSYNPLAQTVSYVLILKTTGRIYGLDVGKGHHNPTCETLNDTHKHRWTENDKGKWAYIPQDITAEASNPVDLWQQFCREANLSHNGRLSSPPPFQKELFL
jgi:hypothetical protein